MNERRRIQWGVIVPGSEPAGEGWFVKLDRSGVSLVVIIETDDGRIITRGVEECRFVGGGREVVNK